MATTITSAGVTFTDTTTLTSANGVPSALKLTTARTINGVSFDGTGNITIPATSISGANVAKAWVNFNGSSAFYTSSNTVTYVANSPSAGQTTVTVDRGSAWSPLPIVGDWVTVSGVTGATAVNGTFQITAVDNALFNIKYIVPSVFTGTVGGTAIANIAAIRSSFNVSSITKSGLGDYTVNFATPMADANYSFFGCGRNDTDGAGGYPVCMSQWLSDTQTINALQIRGTNGNNNLEDFPTLCVSIFGN